MNTIQANSCSESVRLAIPFRMIVELEQFSIDLCARGLNPKHIAWLILLHVLRPQVQRDVDGRRKRPPIIPPADFHWHLWHLICDWVKKQPHPISSKTMREVFVQVYGGQIKALDAAIELIEMLIANHPNNEDRPKLKMWWPS